MNSKLTRERLQELAAGQSGFNLRTATYEEPQELARMALAAMDSEPDRNPVLAYADSYRDMAKQGVESVPIWSVITDLERNIAPLYRHAQPAPERDRVRCEHAEWSQATFGNVGPIGPLKHLRKEALEAIAKPQDLIEWADMQFLLWDAQRRAGITDEQITLAMIEKLAVNKQREWPEPKDGEPRLHIKEQPAPVVPENCVTAEHRRVIEMLLNVCGAAFELADDSCQQDIDGEDCHVVPDDAFQNLSDALDEIENTLPTEDIDRPDVFLAWSAMPRAALKSLLQAQPVPVVPYDFDFDRFNDVVWLECVASNPHMHSPTTSIIARVALELNKRILAGNSPVIPEGYVMVPKDLLSELRDWAHPEIEKYCEMWEGRRDSEFPALRKVIADADALLAAAPQEVKGE